MYVQLGHVYPRPGSPLSEQVIIDLSQNADELAAAKGDEYPLIFRLETISEKGLLDGHVLEVLHVSMCKHQSPVSSLLVSGCTPTQGTTAYRRSLFISFSA